MLKQRPSIVKFMLKQRPSIVKLMLKENGKKTIFDGKNY